MLSIMTSAIASAKDTDMTPVVRSIELANGPRLDYIEQGDPAGVPVLFLHGVTDSWHSFDLVLPHLPKSIHAFAVSQRGHGDSERPATGYATRDFAADAVAFIDAMKLERAVVVGHSMGSYNAQRFAIDYSDRTLGLVLVGAHTTLRDDAGLKEFWDTGVSRLEDPIDPSFALDFQKSTLYQAVPDAFLATAVQESLKVPARVWKATFKGFLESDFWNELGEIEAPTLIVWGEKDAIFHRHHQEALAAGIPGSRLVIYSGTGHAVHWEKPQRFVADLVQFVEELRKH
jgi:pimeloyl-ACP methyl ester carboxylesterase